MLTQLEILQVYWKSKNRFFRVKRGKLIGHYTNSLFAT